MPSAASHLHLPGPMAMAPNGSGISRQPHEVIEIDSDSDNEIVEIPRPAPGPPVACLPPQPLQPAFPRRPWDEELATAAPEAEQQQEVPDHGRRNYRPAPAEPQPHAAHPLTADECLAKVLDIYPDISHEHVRGIFRDDLDVGIQPDSTWCEQLIVRVLDEGAYPTEREARRAALKRKREPSEHEFDQNPMESATPVVRRAYQSAAMILLQNEYPEIPVKFIDQTLREQRSFYNAFLLLEATERTYYATDIARRLYKKVRSRDPKSLDNHYALAHEGAHVEAMEKVRREVAAAKKKVGQDTAKRQDAQKKALEEEHNKAIAVSSNAMMECLCCFDKFPTNRMTFCNGEQAHFYCHGCASSWVNSQLGDGKCWPKCLGQDGCEAEILQSELKAFLDPQTYGRLERMQQQDSLRNAGLSDLVYCPFCDFAAQCEPVEINREFHCQNSDCGVLSCRLCRAESHTPKTCEEAVKDRKGNARHQVEEAMTEALLRTCNKCKARFLKSEGCNKMTCPTCYNTQCYVCSKTVNGYDHFHESAGKCPLYDNNTEKRHQEEVKAAEAAAREAVQRENPDITDEELKIQVSDSVQQEEQRRMRAGERPRHGRPPYPIFPPPGPRPHLHVPAPPPAQAPFGLNVGAFGGPQNFYPPRQYQYHQNFAGYHPPLAPNLQRQHGAGFHPPGYPAAMAQPGAWGLWNGQALHYQQPHFQNPQEQQNEQDRQQRGAFQWHQNQQRRPRGGQ